MSKFCAFCVLLLALSCGYPAFAQTDNDVSSPPIAEEIVLESGSLCGNGKVDVGEQCDGQAGINPLLHECSPECRLIQFPRCGNFKRENAEECDGNDGVTDARTYCDAGCRIKPKCGNGVKDDGEQCDGKDGVENAGEECAPDCQIVPLCGNGRLDAAEECDGKTGITNAKKQKCDSACRIVVLPGK